MSEIHYVDEWIIRGKRDINNPKKQIGVVEVQKVQEVIKTALSYEVLSKAREKCKNQPRLEQNDTWHGGWAGAIAFVEKALKLSEVRKQR